MKNYNPTTKQEEKELGILFLLYGREMGSSCGMDDESWNITSLSRPVKYPPAFLENDRIQRLLKNYSNFLEL